MGLSIAIDGPSGAGKSTIASMLARRLGILHLNTGAMYRALGLLAIRSGANLDDPASVEGLLALATIDVALDAGVQTTYLNGENVTGLLGTQEVSDAASRVSALPPVRRHMVALQREIGRTRDIVADGRDIGTAVLPDATLKVFLTASLEERARRRYLELSARGEDRTLEQVRREIAERDARDEGRAHSPAVAAPDARILDCSRMDERQVVQTIMEWLESESGGAT